MRVQYIYISLFLYSMPGTFHKIPPEVRATILRQVKLE